MKPTFHIVGDSFVDLLCFLDGNGLPDVGGDSRLEQPVTAVAGGSGLNTTTHLQALSRYNATTTTSCSKHLLESSASSDILLHTAFNPHDQYGQILVEHAQQHGFPLLNCRRERGCHENGDERGSSTSNGNKKKKSSDSTGHCVIIISGGERSFMTHVGCLENFKASDVDMNRILSDSRDRQAAAGGPIHIHIAGYFNLEGFHDGNLATQLESIRHERHQCQLPTVVSLVAQHDATEQWDGGLVDHVMPLLDFLIVNELEASRIVQHGRRRQGASVDADTSAAILEPEEWISYFGSIHTTCTNSNNVEQSSCIVVVTRGSQGAMAFCNGSTIAMVEPAVQVPVVVDPTGAGDAFAAGFLHGIWVEQNHDNTCTGTHRIEWSVEAIQKGLLWGCAMGTATVSIRGASIPPQQDALVDIYEKQKQLLE